MLRGFWAVTGMALRTFLRDRTALFWGVAFPLLLMGLIGSVFGRGGDLVFTTSVVKQGHDPISDGIVAAFRQIPALKVKEEDEATALAALKKGDRSLVVILPAAGEMAPGTTAGPGFPTMLPPPGRGTAAGTADLAGLPEPLRVRVYYDQAHAQVAQTGVAIVRSVIEETNRRLTHRPDLLTVEAEAVASKSRHLNMFDFLLPGMLAMTIMSSGLMGVTWVISTYRERKVLKRVLATPFHPAAFLAGMVARFSLTNLLQAAIIVLVGVLVFHARVVGSYLNLAALAVLGSITFVAVGFAVSTVSKTPEAASNLGNAIAFPMMFLSGTFWPKEMIPDALQPVIRALPLTPLVDAMRGVATQADSLALHLGGILYMMAWAVAAFALASWRFRWE